MDFQSFIIPVAQAAEEAAHSTSPVAVLGLNLSGFIAQLINFGIVLFILWKWVFTPVTKKLQERTAKIEKSLNDAETVAKDKQEFEKWKNEQIVNARHEASIIISKAQVDATKVKEDLAAQSKSEQEKIIADAKVRIEQEKNQTMASAKGELADLVTMATEKIIRQKMDGKMDKQLVNDTLKSMS